MLHILLYCFWTWNCLLVILALFPAMHIKKAADPSTFVFISVTDLFHFGNIVAEIKINIIHLHSFVFFQNRYIFMSPQIVKTAYMPI